MSRQLYKTIPKDENPDRLGDGNNKTTEESGKKAE
jgi:hypothetical protein